MYFQVTRFATSSSGSLFALCPRCLEKSSARRSSSGISTAEFLLQEPEQLYHPYRIDVSVLEQVDFPIEPGIGRADIELMC